MKLPIYMDAHATTPVDPRVLKAMMPYFSEKFGNPASTSHPFGWEGEEAVQKAREQIASAINATASEIVFTSGATESDNLAILGVAEAYKQKGNHIITSRAEHPAVLDACRQLEKHGFSITYLNVDEYGVVDLEALANSIKDTTILVSIIAANNEIGTISPIRDIGELTRSKGVLFHADAVQAVGKIPFDVEENNVDLASISGHKMYGPKGIGALYIRKKNPRVRIEPMVFGGGHEKGWRSGTLNVPGIVGLGTTCEINSREMSEEAKRISNLRDRLYTNIRSRLEDVFLLGHPDKRLPNNLNLAFKYVEGASIIMELREVALSASSACTSHSLEASHVLEAIGIPGDLALSAIRFGLHRFTTGEEVDYVAERIVNTVGNLRNMSPVYAMDKQAVLRN